MEVRSRSNAGREIIHDALRRKMAAGLHLRCLRGSLQIGAALPVYRITRRAALQLQPLSGARKIGWLYPIIGGEIPGVALLLKKGNQLRFAGIHEGTLSQMLLETAEAAEERLGPGAKNFHPRLLEIPALRIHALWMYASGGGSFFFPISDRRTGDTSVQTEVGIADLIHTALARTKVEHR